ncbi:hypothetical protein B0H14DRAFT_2577804 [Mycena olivaceomarginata]|nr:hypothetical protein B0H14DRAFT_2577804 [Mycena olivaceomarginata]
MDSIPIGLGLRVGEKTPIFRSARSNFCKKVRIPGTMDPRTRNPLKITVQESFLMFPPCEAPHSFGKTGLGSPWLAGYTGIMQISVDQCRQRISLSSSKPQPAYNKVSAWLYRLSEPNPAAATKRQYYKSFSAANQVASNTLTDLPWAALTSLKIQTAALTCPDLG